MAFDIKGRFFDVTIGGKPATREELLDWDKRDRLAIIVDRPLGGLDAGLMIMLTATAFYDAGKKRRMRPLYPDMYLFHAGGPWGAHMAFDFAPDRKEIHVEADPVRLLQAINQIGITHLLIPDRPQRPVQHRYKEPEAAIDRIKKVFVYGPSGSLAQPDVRITANTFAPLAGTFEGAIDPEPMLNLLDDTGNAAEVRATDRAELEILVPMMRARLSEVAPSDPDRLRQIERVAEAKGLDTLSEDYRRVDIADALNMLDPS